MINRKINYKNAEVDDINNILKLMREYYAYENVQLNQQDARERLEEFIKNCQLGKIWLIEIDKTTAGYIVVTHGFGLEHGRNVTIDEFYIRENFRGQGIGQRTMQFIEEELRSMGISSIQTEVERKNHKAREFWEKLGFQKYDRFPMTKMIKNT